MVVTLSLPFDGRWLALNSPARRVPSPGVGLYGERYAIDFVAVDDRGRSASAFDLRSLTATEPPERFLGFGMPVLAPVAGRGVGVHDGEDDHAAHRSLPAGMRYLSGQRARLARGMHAITGNHLVVHDWRTGSYVAMVHLKRGSLEVGVGDDVVVGQPLARCGNSGNSTQPHVHIQAMDDKDPERAWGLPIAFVRYRQWGPGRRPARDVEVGVPDERAIVANAPAAPDG